MKDCVMCRSGGYVICLVSRAALMVKKGSTDLCAPAEAVCINCRAEGDEILLKSGSVAYAICRAEGERRQATGICTCERQRALSFWR